jgi:hypothetical protein
MRRGLGVNTAKFMMVMNTTDMKWAQYTVGELRATKREDMTRLGPPGLTGKGKQYFSNRTWGPEPAGFERVHPFDPNKTDDVQIDIKGSLFMPNKPNNDSVTFTALSWGNAKSSSVPECKNGFMYGFVEGGGMYVISFQKVSNPR